VSRNRNVGDMPEGPAGCRSIVVVLGVGMLGCWDVMHDGCTLYLEMDLAGRKEGD
jgi:hypothetical protein